METSTIINIIGLSFDIIGVVLLFFYEPPKDSHALLLESAPSKDDREKIRKTKRKFSVIGLVLLIIGFSLQIISNFF